MTDSTAKPPCQGCSRIGPTPGFNVVSIQVRPDFRGEVSLKFGPNGVEQTETPDRPRRRRRKRLPPNSPAPEGEQA